jgi:hypothetical protein
MQDSPVIEWLLSGDVAIQYQVRRDLLGENPDTLDMRSLKARIAREGWGERFLSARRADGHWGLRFYQPKWTSSNYTLMDLRSLETPATPEIVESVCLIAQTEKSPDGGINPARSIAQSDVCINGMYLNYGCFFGVPESDLKSVVDFVLSQHMPDGGFNCRLNRSGAKHSSMHSTIQLLEGIHEYESHGYTYRCAELHAAAESSREFLLQHRLYKSDHTGETIHGDFLRLAYPWRWKYNVLRALDHFRAAQIPWDDRMQDALDVVNGKRRPDGRWPLQAAWPGQVHFKMEEGRKPSRWNTLIALRVLARFVQH